MTATPRVFLYEFVTGGGCWSQENAQPPHGSLLAEGKAMLQALAGDLLASGNFQLHLLADSRLDPFWPDGCCIHQVAGREDERRLVHTLARSEFTLLVAPEFDDLLRTRAQWVTSVGDGLQTPDAEYVALAANKSRLADHLHAAGIPLPGSVTLEAGAPLPRDFCYPAVLKPIDGAGSIDVRFIRTSADVMPRHASRRAWRLEAFHRGTPASVAVLCGPRQHVVLPPSQQLLSNDGQFRFLGNRWPLSQEHHERAVDLARHIVLAMPPTRGYVGIDLVLGEAIDGRDDVVIEVNPRLTSSYPGLRKLAKTNLAEAMLHVATGLPSTLEWHDLPLTHYLGQPDTGAHQCIG